MIEAEIPNAECKMQKKDKAVICLVRDLLFYSKIRAAAESAKVPLKSLRDPAKLQTEIGIGLIVDLNQPTALQSAANWKRQTNRPVVGFVSHVDTQTIVTARAAGINRILARSQFEQNLPAILHELIHFVTKEDQ
jgi:hypothetical protein